MKRQLFMTILTLMLGASFVSAKEEKDAYFNPRLGKSLKRVPRLSGFKTAPFEGLRQKARRSRSEGFIDWRALYWGDLSDLTVEDEDGALRDASDEEALEDPAITAAFQVFAAELRQALEAFAAMHGVALVWRRKEGAPDMTSQFIDWWGNQGASCPQITVHEARKEGTL